MRTFRTVVRCVDDATFVQLDPGETRGDSVTLMRGAEGALFAAPGMHHVEVEVHWEVDGTTAIVRGASTVLVTGVVDAAHAAAAHRVLATPDAHLVLAIGGDHLVEGIAAIQAALESSVLRPHFAVIEAKRVGRRFAGRKPDVKGAVALIDESTVMSDVEMAKMLKIASDGPATAGKEMAKAFKAQAKGRTLSKAAKKVLDAL